MKLSLTNPQRGWTALGEVASVDGKGGGWLALDPLRRPSKPATGGKVVPRVWTALVQVRELRLLVPLPAGEGALVVGLATSAPAVSCVFDHPGPAAGTSKEPALGEGVATSFSLELPI